MLYFIGYTGPFPWFGCACAFNCSAFTMTNIALERYLVLCKDKNTNDFSFIWSVGIIVILAIVLMLPFHRWYRQNFCYFVITRTWQFLVQGAIPCTSLLFLN